MFIGNTFAGVSESLHFTATATDDITTIELKNMILDEMYATKTLLTRFNWKIPEEWDLYTHLHALFAEDLMAGNVSYAERIVAKIKIKKRLRGEFTWKTIIEKEINCNDDFEVEFYDYYNPAKVNVEYAYVAVIGGADTDFISVDVYSDFNSYFLCGKNVGYPLILDTSNTVEMNRNTTTITTLGRKYPYVISNGTAKYYAGTLSATFIELIDCDFDVVNGWKYRNSIDEFLSNGDAKIIKSFEGDMYMVNLIDNISRSENGHYQNISHQINWVECGNPYDIGDLYDNNFIDTDIDRGI